MGKFAVLIVDDEADVRSAIGRSLRREGYELHFASGGPEALDILQRVEIDIVITDHRMPGMTGLELIKLVKDTYPDVMRVILTGNADFDTIKAAVNEAEIYRFLTKPWDDDDLRLTLKGALERRELEREVRRLAAVVRRQESLLNELEKTHPGITKVERDASGAIVIPDEE